MLYRAVGLMSGSSLDGLDIVFAEFQEQAGKWSYQVLEGECYPYSGEWVQKLKNAVHLSAKEYQLLHTEYGHYLGQQVNHFIEKHGLHYKISVIASHGHTTFHIPAQRMTAQLGDGAAIAAQTELPVVTDLRALDVAFGGQGAPIVPIGEKLLMGEYDYFLNIGGIANISARKPHPNPLLQERASNTPQEEKSLPSAQSSGEETYIAFDICPANRVLNMLANESGKEFDKDGEMAAAGTVQNVLLEKLNALDYYAKPFPKSLANDFGTDIVFHLIKNEGTSTADALRTYTEHIAVQINNATSIVRNQRPATSNQHLLATGGGTHNKLLIDRIRTYLGKLNIEVVVPDNKLVNYKEALIMAFIGVLRWRQEYNVLSSVTGASRNSIGGALWTGQEA
jgi:anhydro-N-acetylmuramic acid kinase